MSDKLTILVAYALSGIALALAPFVLRRLHGQSRTWEAAGAVFGHERWASAISVAFAVIALFLSRSLASPVVALVFVVVALLLALHRGRADRDEAAGAVAAVVIAATLPWWRREDTGLLLMDWTKLPVFFLATLLVCHALRLEMPQAPSPRGGKNGYFTLLAVLVVAIMSFGTGAFPSGRLDGRTIGDDAWHHWGAYVGPAELVASGARLFHDLPAQYGLGPTLLVAAVCTKSCWVGMYWLAASVSVAFFILITGMAHRLRGSGQTPLAHAIVNLLCIFSCLFWTAFPFDLGTPIVWPSVGGLRFLPVVALVALLFWKDTGGGTSVAHAGPTRWGHLAWALGTLWSPESGFCVTFVWWPYYLWRRCGQSAEGQLIPNLFAAAATLLLYTAALIGFFLSAYWLAYGTSPTRVGVLAYFLHPPGAEPINPVGAIWFFGTVLILGLVALHRIYRATGDSGQFRRGFLVLLLAYGTFSYFLGRSVENNLLNLMPYQLLVLIAALDAGMPKAARHLAVVLLGSLLGWSGLFGWSVWVESARAGRLFEFEPSNRIGMFRQHPDAERAVTFIRDRFNEPALVLDHRFNLTVTSNPAPWSAIHGPANYLYLPAEMRREFLLNTAQTLRRAGWLVVLRQAQTSGEHDPDVVGLVESSGLLQDIYRIYRPTQGLNFGTYHAIRFEPR